MDKKSLIKIVQTDMQAAQSIVGGFDANGQVSDFEIELALSRLNALTRELELLKTLNNTSPQNTPQNIPDITTISTPQPPINITQPATEPEPEAPKELPSPQTAIEPEPVTEIITSPVTETKPAEVNPEPVIPITNSEPVNPTPDNHPIPEALTNTPIIQEPETPSAPTAVNPAKPEQPDLEIKPEVAKPKEKSEIIADKFQQTSQNINDTLNRFKKDKDLATLLINRPVTDLKKAIKLNDRIWYINELFNKDAAQFDMVVNQLNSFVTLDEALTYIFDKFNWDQNQKSTISFLELVFRRFTR